jgi:hypothetical protein
MSGRLDFLLSYLCLKIILQAHLVDLVELGFQPVEMILFIMKIGFDEFA